LRAESYNCTYWNRNTIADKPVTHNRQDITLVDNSNKTAYLIEVSVPNTFNILKYKEIENYQPSSGENKCMRQQGKVFVVPVIVSLVGVLPEKCS
jgi:hypothetical protein